MALLPVKTKFCEQSSKMMQTEIPDSLDKTKEVLEVVNDLLLAGGERPSPQERPTPRAASMSDGSIPSWGHIFDPKIGSPCDS